MSHFLQFVSFYYWCGFANSTQIKNTIRTAQALAVNKKEPLSMEHIKRVLDVSNAFDRDLKGGPGFEDAMRGYF